MTEPIWQTLISLVDIDNQISSIENENKVIDNQIQENRHKIQELQNSLLNKKSELLEKQKKADFVELQIREIDQIEAEKKKSLDLVNDQKSYAALQKELSNLSFERSDKEELLVEAWRELEITQKKVEEESNLLEEQNKNFENKFGDFQKQKNLVLEKVKVLLEKRSEIEKTVLPIWLSKYEKMRKQVPNPIVKISNSCCSACYYMVLTQDLAKILKGSILPCRNCYRLLYFDQHEKDEPVF
ncbi:TPA: hypothetical protein DEO28_01455 [Candidatus Dependentiae bacterium]|nr:MAG: hypothetical protein UR14_C0003G0138 [candidate division TM6 bacterium GW2011_GWE2_31_21]KKP53698.1 MAG: hypothetical protein UR43_C0003G0019 [candidate division TM6 bacterium GW2011_GWF2_33_332]HBS48550.1 hypothetical protein [Candidatus Dependentiae bacterium]HBZ73165.1 hypothetical protein [Candidatus Dependentiae bacterium]